MGKSKKQVMHSRQEEKQAKKVLLIIGAVGLALMVGLIVLFS